MSCFFAVVGIFSTDRAVALNWQNGVAPGAVWQSIGNCRLQLNLYTSGSWRIAEVFLYDATYSAKWSPGGVAVGYPNPGTYDDPNSGVLDEQVLLDQCGIAVENLVSTSPAVGASFAETVYFGFSFDYHNVNYEYAFSGANNTNVINSGDVDDTTPPTVSSVSIASNNPTTTLAVANDVVTLTFTASETISTPVVTFLSGGNAITDTSVTYDNTSGNTWTAAYTANASDTAGSVTYSIAFSDTAGNAGSAVTSGTGSVTYDGTAPTVTLTGPSGVVTADFTVTATFSEAVTGFALNDITITNGTASSLVTGNAPVYTFTVTPTLDTTVSISIAANIVTDTAGNANTASNTLSIASGGPASEFTAKEGAIRSVITNDAQRSLSSALASNTRLTRKARGRFLDSRKQMRDGETTVFAFRNNEAFDIDGTAVASADQIATQGMFFAQTGNFEGTQRRLVFGDFDVQRHGDTGSTTATINGKVAWEQMLSEQTMLGYYLGGEVSRSNIKGSFTGTKDAYGVSVGGYFVHALQENLFLDGFASLGAGRNDLEMADDTLALTSDYTTQTVALGAAVSGIIEQAGYDILPELSVTYGRTSIGNVGFTGVAYGLTDDTLSLDAGNVSTATILFRPEVRVPMNGLAASDRSSVFSFAPRVMCERVKVASTTNNCGSGAELGISSSSSDGLTSLNTTIIADRVGNSTRSSLQFNLQHKF